MVGRWLSSSMRRQLCRYEPGVAHEYSEIFASSPRWRVLDRQRRIAVILAKRGYLREVRAVQSSQMFRHRAFEITPAGLALADLETLLSND